MRVPIKVDRWNPDREVIDRAVSILKSGGLVGFPTETVYGLGADGLDGKAVSGIFEAKGRPSDNPLILHVGDPESVRKIAKVDDRADMIMKNLWPGPLTLVLPALPIVPPEVTAGLDTVGVRMPSHPVALALLQACPFPVAAPSANTSGRPSPTDAVTVARDLDDRVDLIIDGGATEVGLESTVLDVTGEVPVLLRPGGLSVEVLADLLGEIALPVGELELKRSPGTRYRHYAPSVPLILWIPEESGHPDFGESCRYIGMVEPVFPVDKSIIFDSVESYGRGLFSALRELEREWDGTIVAQWPDSDGIGLALRDRLRRASGGR
ncbi:Sua5/YciO/YrdC/YwlC family protein [Dethiosulfovibrio peptidovorans DSM 11002]|uniref:Threonylcarbamoyl-AMP synthase n=1 Tax=Dethiosulfovibrio peptidovorans DSM 11002 TaxID=469381 RepID=D2Z904_9BACT|nr:L-threonylcarbamoyladenylate synthase [Dethiosulfovibrio peptidovorans]EFC91951.1 Sua5/YciO/YrdC/YwlC family protein [Dethiosulfovibrio peptidovorans DSM 11002]